MLKDLFQSVPFLNFSFLGNTLADWILAAVIFIVIVVVLKFFRYLIISKLNKLSKKTKTEIDDIIIEALNTIHWPFYIYVAFYISLQYLNLSKTIGNWIYYIFLIAVVYYTIRFLQRLVEYGADAMIKKHENGQQNEGVVKLLVVLIKIILWMIAIVMVMSNMGYNVTSLITGLGIGGVAIALAVQNILGDLFSSLAIYFDKPFKVGDFIVVGNYMGTVQKIGIKSTRIQALQGEEVVISNNELTKTEVQNFGLMKKRRIVFDVGVAYDTPSEKLKEIPDIIKSIVNSQDVDLDRVHFKSFGDSSLVYEVVYYVKTGDYNTYMDIQQNINLGIIDRFNKEKIEIAFPTRTIYLKK